MENLDLYHVSHWWLCLDFTSVTLRMKGNHSKLSNKNSNPNQHVVFSLERSGGVKLVWAMKLYSKLTPKTYTVYFSAKQYRRSVNVVSSLAENESNQPDQNKTCCLIHSYQGRRSQGGLGRWETGVQLAKEKEKLSKEEKERQILFVSKQFLRNCFRKISVWTAQLAGVTG